MERQPAMPPLTELEASDLAALRLTAQVMAHRAQLAGRPAVVLYFDSLEAAVLAEEAARGQQTLHAAPPAALLDAAVGPADRRLIYEYLALIADNERLSASVRRVCGALRARYGE